MAKETGRKLIAQNKKARHDYHIDDTYEAGIVLQGTEVKSLRAGRASLVDGFAEVENGEVFLHQVHIPTYAEGTWTNHEVRRRRKLLLNRAEIDKIDAKVREKGFTLIPLALYFKDGRAKVEIGAGARQEVLRQAAVDRRRAPPSARRRSPSAASSRAWGDRAVDRPLTDEDVPAWWQALGLPGLFDVHVHFLPPRMQAKVWAQFDNAGPLIGRPWPIRYRGSDEERVEQLRALGVRRFSALSYAHVPGMAESLNDWAADFADRVPECAPLGHVLPRARRRGVRRPPARAPGWRCSRCTSRSAPSTSASRSSTRCGGCSPRRAPGGRPRRFRAGAHRVHRARSDAGGPRAAPAADGRDRAHGRAGVPRVPRDGRAVRADPPRHHDGVHVVLRGRGAVPARPPAAAGRPRATRCCSARTSRTSRTPTPTSSRRSRRWAWGRSGCARSAGRTETASDLRVGQTSRTLRRKVVGRDLGPGCNLPSSFTLGAGGDGPPTRGPPLLPLG